jgi:Ca2+-binding RTX toxin-like protein
MGDNRMAKIRVVGDVSYLMGELDFGIFPSSEYALTKPRIFRVDHESGYSDQYKGSGFRYGGDEFGTPNAGTITSYALLYEGNTVAVIDGIKISMKKMMEAASTTATTDDMAIMRQALKGNDQIIGGSNDDILMGYKGNDVLKGGDGDDYLIGGAGKDRLHGGNGFDYLYGEAGADTFMFERISDSYDGDPDTIGDFSRKQGDRINLKAIDADTTTAGNGAFKFIGAAEFSGKAGELRYFKNDAETRIEGDIDGDGVRDLVLYISFPTKLIASDFIL